MSASQFFIRPQIMTSTAQPSLHDTEPVLTPKKAKTPFPLLLTEGTTRDVPRKRLRRRRGRPTSSNSLRALPPLSPRELLLRAETAPINPFPAADRRFDFTWERLHLRETSGKAGQRATPPKAQSWSTLFRLPTQTCLSHCASRSRSFPGRVLAQPPALHAGKGLPPPLRDFSSQEAQAS